MGNVKTVVTIGSMVKETEQYDAAGRLLQRVQEPADGRAGLGRLTFVSQYDAAGRKIVDLVRDPTDALIKETVYVYDPRGEHRTAEVSVWAGGVFANASFYEYDGQGNRVRGLHFNAPALVNRNLFQYDELKRVLKETYTRNYSYDSQSGEAVLLPGLTAGYDVRIRYTPQGLIAEKLVSDLRGVRESRSEFDYDEQGQQIEERVYDRKDRLMTRKQYEYSYDLRGNWVSETFQWWEIKRGRAELKQVHTRRRHITYYEES